MYTRLKFSKKAKYPTLQIVEGIREGGKVRQKTIAHLGVIKGPKDHQRLLKLAENLIQRLEKEGLQIDLKVKVKDLVHKKTVYDGFGKVIDKLMLLTGFSEVLQKIQGNQQFNLEEITKLLITQQFDRPGSKLKAFHQQEEHGFRDIELQSIYRTMDAIEPFADEFQTQAYKTLCRYSEGTLDCFLFDVTTLYFESIAEDDLRGFGFSKDQKHHCVQIVLALVTDSEGTPVGYGLFEGDLAETKTLIPVLDSLRSRFSIKNVIVVCDRGMASNENVTILRQGGFQYVIATKLKSISKKLHINDLTAFVPLPCQDNISEKEKVLVRSMPHPQYEDALLIVTYSPARAEKDKKDRERLIEKLESKLSSSLNATSVKKVISNNGYKKFTSVKEGSLITINEEAIREDESWDGFHGIAVSNGANLGVTEALSRYRGLWHIEEAFRVEKCTLRARPIFHWKSRRIKAHILLCFLSLFLERFLELLLRKNGCPLTPDRIRSALFQVHTTVFEDQATSQEGKMLSALSPDAEKIFRVLELSCERKTVFG